MSDDDVFDNEGRLSSDDQPEDRLLGLAEVADLLRTSRQTVINWRQRREGFPKPLVDLKSGPVWRRGDIVAWADDAGVKIADDDTSSLLGDSSRGPMATVALINMKGGVGKSTLTANLGWFCAYRKNQRVLLVDLDPQFNLSQYVMGTAGYEEHRDADKGTVLDIFEQATPSALAKKNKKKGDDTPSDVIAHVQSWSDGSLVDLVPSSLDLAWTLKNPTGKAELLGHFLDEVRSSYDMILIDCAPTESILTEAAYRASDSVLVPVKPEYLSTIGLPLLVRSLEDFKRVSRQTVDVLGIVFNASADKIEHDRSRSVVRKVADDNGWYVFENEVSYSDSYPKGSRYGKPIFLTDYARRHKISELYSVGEEFLRRLES
jgi:chromosome partitioning protein